MIFTPWDLLGWALAAAAAIMIIGVAIAVVGAINSGITGDGRGPRDGGPPPPPPSGP